ncbi:MAG: phospholipase [Planctomycetota bacterium]|nr:phospholipase [Planctomycetota bacterium]
MTESHLLRVSRTVRVEVSGDPATARETWILVHGYAQLATEMLEACKALEGQERLLVVPEALSRFYRRGSSGPIGASWMTRERREEEIADYVAYLDEVARWSEREGAATVWRWAALGTTRLERLISFGGGVPPDVDLVQAKVKLEATRIELFRGRSDAYHTAEWLERDRARLAGEGLACAALEFDGGHELPPEVLVRLGGATQA